MWRRFARLMMMPMLATALIADGARTALALEAGTTVSASSWQQATPFLPEEILSKIRDGDFAVTVAPTTAYPMRPVYAAATRAGRNAVALGSAGELEHYVAGQPFPDVDPADPRAGEKIAWNVRYRDTGTTIQEWLTIDIMDGDRRQRSMDAYYAIAWGMHRAEGEQANIWQGDRMLYKELTRVLAPLDLRDTTMLKHRPDRDADEDVDWMYTKESRRVRRVLSRHDEQAMGSELLSEDFWGFSGYLRAYDWKLVGEQDVLVPTGGSSIAVTYGGRNGWYPVDPWEVRKAWVIEAVSRDPKHPYGRRRIYVDRETSWILGVIIFDRGGQHLKTMLEVYVAPRHSPENAEAGVPLLVGESIVNYQKSRATLMHLSRVLHNRPLKPELFTVDEMVSGGR